MSRPGNAAAVFTALRVAGQVADHYVQTGHQAVHKADEGLAGHKAMAGHIASYAGSQALFLAAANSVLGMRLRKRDMAAAIVFSGATHWFIDRRWPVRKLAEATGKTGFHDLGGPLGGAYILDQSAHHLMEALAAVLAVRGDRD